MGGITVTQRFKIAKTFHSEIQDDGHLEILQTTSPKLLSQIESKLDGKHHSDTEIQNC